MQPHQTQIRTYSYQPPHTTPRDFAQLTGLEFMERLLRGEIPRAPMAATLDFEITRVERGLAVVEATTPEWCHNPIGSVHGGYAATLLDTALGCAVHTALPAGVGYTTLELKLNFVRALLASTGRVRVEGKVVHAGARIATAEARLFAVDSGRLYAHGTTTCLLVPHTEGTSRS